MNPNQSKNEQPSINLPRPSVEAPESRNQPAKPELDYQLPQASGSQLQSSGVVPAMKASPMGVNPFAGSNQPLAPVPNNQLPANIPHTAGDIDLMEKEWMVRAKHLLAKNLNNPYEQAKEITTLRTAYLKKRFNKEIKATDG